MVNSKRIFVLAEDVNYFGTIIPRGTVYKQKAKDQDYYECYKEEDGLIMQCPSYNLHFMVVKNNPLFIETFLLAQNAL